MALYAIGDTHLSLGSDKPMDVFGGGWAQNGGKRASPRGENLFCGKKETIY